MDRKEFFQCGLKAAGAMSGINLLILGIMMLFGYDSFPVDPNGSEMSAFAFVIGTIITGGIFPGLIGMAVWLKLKQRWDGQALMIFAIIALLIATLMTLPITNPNAPTGDAFVLTTVLHYSTAILGIWLIPHFSKVETID